MSGELGRALRWPLWSWRNLTITAVLMLALLAVVGRATDGQASPRRPQHQPPCPRVPPPKGPFRAHLSADTEAHDDGGLHVGTAGLRSGHEAVRHCGGRRLRSRVVQRRREQGCPGMPPWSRGRAPMLRALASTDPTQVPADRVTGDARLTSSAKTSATVLVPTDGGDVLVTLTFWWWLEGARHRPADAPPAAETPSLTRTTPGPDVPAPLLAIAGHSPADCCCGVLPRSLSSPFRWWSLPARRSHCSRCWSLAAPKATKTAATQGASAPPSPLPLPSRWLT